MIIKTLIPCYIRILRWLICLLRAILHFLELLYFAPDRYLYVSDIGMELIKNRDMFLSKRVCHAYKGYICDCLEQAYVRCSKSDDIQKKTKFANKSMMHAVRLLLQVIQLLQCGTMCGTIEEIGKDLIDIKMGYNTLCEKRHLPDGTECTDYRPNESYNVFTNRLLSEFEYGYNIQPCQTNQTGIVSITS